MQRNEKGSLVENEQDEVLIKSSIQLKVTN